MIITVATVTISPWYSTRYEDRCSSETEATALCNLVFMVREHEVRSGLIMGQQNKKNTSSDGEKYRY